MIRCDIDDSLVTSLYIITIRIVMVVDLQWFLDSKLLTCVYYSKIALVV